MPAERYFSWGRYPKARHAAVRRPAWNDAVDVGGAGTRLPFGRGRSYGDCCLNDGGELVDTSRLDRILGFDAASGIIRCEAGMTFGDILEVIVPKGWFLPVTPGTKEVSVGGAVANDIHGKNHHVAGTFGRHVIRFELVRSDGSKRVCSATENGELFAATIGGIGLTGLVTWVEFRLRRIPGPAIMAERVRFGTYDDFLALSRESDGRFEHVVAWLDTTAPPAARGRGIFFRGNHAEGAAPRPRRFGLTVPGMMPERLLGPTVLRAFNSAYYHRPAASASTAHYDGFFYPLDKLGEWHRLYGRRGFVQYQCAIPYGTARESLSEILGTADRYGLASFLSVLKAFGDLPSPGLLSFPMPGVTLAMDFPFRGAETLDALTRLDDIVLAAGGRLYPAKDARMSGAAFRKMYPSWEELARLKDPAFSSSFWRRVTV